MSTKEQIKAKLDNLDEAALKEIYRLIKQIEQAHGKNIPQAQPKSSGLCGIWSDDRSAEEIVNARSSGRDVVL